MTKNVPSVDVEQIFTAACELPGCKIDREEYLTNELRNRVSAAQLADALANGTVNAGIPVRILDDIAKGAIALETSRVVAISAAAGMPGGLAMFVAVPADLAQLYAHVFRIAQKLAYVYGSKEIGFNDGTKNVLMLYLGAMFGVREASAALVKLSAASAVKIGARVAAKPLTKYAIYNITKKILAMIGVKLTKVTVGKGVAKAIPVAGAVLSGGLTYAIYRPMAKKLQRELSKLAAMSPENLVKASAAADVILTDFTVITEDS